MSSSASRARVLPMPPDWWGTRARARLLFPRKRAGRRGLCKAKERIFLSLSEQLLLSHKETHKLPRNLVFPDIKDFPITLPGERLLSLSPFRLLPRRRRCRGGPIDWQEKMTIAGGREGRERRMTVFIRRESDFASLDGWEGITSYRPLAYGRYTPFKSRESRIAEVFFSALLSSAWYWEENSNGRWMKKVVCRLVS